MRDKIHALGVRAVANHVRLAALTAPGEVFEADRPTDNPPVQLRQSNVHRQVAGTQALLAGLPGWLVVLRADRLNHRYVAPERAQMRRLRARLGKAGGIENQLDICLIQPVFHLNKAARLLEAGHGDGQRINALCQQAHAEFINETGVGRLQVRAIEQQRHHRLPAPPFGLPIDKLGTGKARVINSSTRQRLGFGPRVIAAQPLTRHAMKQIQCVLHAALAQELPELVALRSRHSTQVAQFGVGTVIARHQNDLHAPRCQLHEPLDAVTPVADATVQGNQNDFGVAQQFIDVQVDRGVILHLHRVGQTQAGVVFGQLPGGFGQQRQAGVAAAENHQLGRGLSHVGDAVVRDETAGLGSQ